MKKVLALLGLVLVSLGVADQAMAQSGSDSSGQHSYSFECVGGDELFTNTGTGRLHLLLSLSGGQPVYTVNAGESLNPPGLPNTYYEVYFEDPAGSDNYHGMDSGRFPDCGEPEPEPTFAVDATPVCLADSEGADVPAVRFTNTGDAAVHVVMGFGERSLEAGETSDIVWPKDANGVPLAEAEWMAHNPDTDELVDSGTLSFAVDNACNEIPDEAPELISECRGADWYLVHPDDSPSVTYAYRMSTGDILYDADYTSNNPAAVYGEVLIPAGVNEVGYADDFNVAHTATRPAECGGPTTPPTAPPTTQPTEPTTPTPETPGINPVSGEGYVAPGAEIGPGQATFGATGFAPGEEVGVTLFSTPRSLGTVTANDAGTASITVDVLASDGAGEHHVVFSGPSGSVSIPFTLVLPEGAAAPTTTVAGQLPVTR